MSDSEILRTGEREVLADVSVMIAEVLADYGGADLDIGMDTQFTADLDMESIDLVTLSVRLREHYGQRVNFAEFIAGFELDEIIELTVGRLVGHIARALDDTGQS